ncbi:MAG: type I glutamate--ammonia ligase [Pseudomonadota bacterium]
MIFTNFNELKTFLEKEEVLFCDFRFTDPRGRWHHIAYNAENISQNMFIHGVMFDGSSIAGWKEINSSDMIIKPDLSSGFIDPFTTDSTIIFICDVIDPETHQLYERDPRSTAKKAELYLANSGIADKAFFGPELEFFIFDSVKYKIGMNECSFNIDYYEGDHNSNSSLEYEANLGHRPGVKGGYMPVMPIDGLNDIRAKMSLTLKEVGLTPILHHHEVAPGQCELGFKYGRLLETADNVQKYKYVIHNVANQFGKSATFMPKPIRDDNGSGMHVHQSLWEKDRTLFAGNKYADLSETALYYIGGIIKHAKAINAFTNPTTNSYKRLVPGFEAPVLLAYSSRNRSASIRIPHVHISQEKRIEVRFPDPTANPYYAFSAMLLAGLDGIKNKIHPGDSNDKNLYQLSSQELENIQTVSGSLEESLNSLSNDREFLKQGNVFTDDQINAYIELKMNEIAEVKQTPHPVEYKLYYSS